MSKKIPWINNGDVGFFEYDMEVYGFILVGRNKMQLQEELSNLLLHQNYDKCVEYIRNKVGIEDFMEKINDKIYVLSIKKALIAKGEIYPDDATIEDVGYNTRNFSEEEIQELRGLLEAFPDLTQIELEDIYFRQNTQNTKYLLYRKSIEDAKKEAERYELDLENSKLMTQMYERSEELEEKIASILKSVGELAMKVTKLLLTS